MWQLCELQYTCYLLTSIRTVGLRLDDRSPGAPAHAAIGTGRAPIDAGTRLAASLPVVTWHWLLSLLLVCSVCGILSCNLLSFVNTTLNLATNYFRELLTTPRTFRRCIARTQATNSFG